MESRTVSGRPWGGFVVSSEANGKELSHNLSPRKTLVAGRRKEGWRSPREHHLPMFIRPRLESGQISGKKKLLWFPSESAGNQEGPSKAGGNPY